ncbi:MAG TPA: hypothetical protein VHO24_18825 [Opitutaceae bacterium]|nr:hypothetical protein [Opitutaceae bacterium]
MKPAETQFGKARYAERIFRAGIAAMGGFFVALFLIWAYHPLWLESEPWRVCGRCCVLAGLFGSGSLLAASARDSEGLSADVSKSEDMSSSVKPGQAET